MPFYTKPNAFDDGSEQKYPFVSVFVYDDGNLSPPHETCYETCGHACRDILLNKDIQSLFLIPGLEDQSTTLIKSTTEFPQTHWQIPSFDEVFTLQSGPDDIPISVANIGALMFFIGLEAFTDLSEVMLNSAVMELRNTWLQLLVDDPYTNELPCWLYVIAKEKETMERHNTASTYNAINKELYLRPFVPLSLTATNFTSFGFWMTDKVRVQLIVEEDVFVGSQCFLPLERRSFQKYQSKTNASDNL